MKTGKQFIIASLSKCFEAPRRDPALCQQQSPSSSCTGKACKDVSLVDLEGCNNSACAGVRNIQSFN